MKTSYTNISMSKTTKKREGDPALSKNHGNSIKYRKRLVEDMEAEQELKNQIDEHEANLDHPSRVKDFS